MELCNVSEWEHGALQCFRVGTWSSAMTSFISPTAVIPWHLVGEHEEFVEGVLLRAGVLLRETQKQDRLLLVSTLNMNCSTSYF